MTTSNRDLEYETLQINFLRKKVESIASGLHSMAEDVERIARFKDTNFVSAASNVTHTVLWGVANLNLDRLASMLGDIVEAREYATNNAAEKEADIPE